MRLGPEVVPQERRLDDDVKVCLDSRSNCNINSHDINLNLKSNCTREKRDGPRFTAAM